MESAPPPPSKIPPYTLERAVTALLEWKSKKSQTQKPQLLPSDEFLYLVLTLNKIPPKRRTNAYRIPLPNPIHSSNSDICLFLDDMRVSSKAAKAKISEEQIPVSKVIRFSKLKTDYKPFEAKRKLCDSYDLFFVDRRIVPLLPRAIGKHFYKKKKIPLPVELGRKNWKEQIQRACGSAFLYLSTGSCSVVRVARGDMGKDEILENLGAVVGGVVGFLPRGGGSVRSLHLKFSGSVALPVYQAVPEMRMRISSGLDVGVGVGHDGEENVGSGKEKVESDGESKKVGKKKKKGRIHQVRYMDSNYDMVGGEESGSDIEEGVEEGEMGSAELRIRVVGKKRRNGGVEKKDSVVVDDKVGEDKPGSDNDEGVEDGEMGSAELSQVVGKKRKNGGVEKKEKKKEKKEKKGKKGLKQKKENGSGKKPDTEKKSKRSKVAV